MSESPGLGEESVRGLLVRLHQYASIALDLSMYALAFGDSTAALEVLKLEGRIDEIYRRIIVRTSLALRSPSQAPLGVGVLTVAAAMNKISDEAGDLAGLVLSGYPVHEYVSSAVNCCGEIVSVLGARRGLSELPSVLDILLIKRRGEYLLAPATERIEEGDLVVVRGPLEEVVQLAENVGEERLGWLGRVRELIISAEAGDELASSLVTLRSIARLMIDLSIYSVLYDDREVAGAVSGMEEYADKLFYEVTESVLQAARHSPPREMVSLAIFVKSLESLADAANEISQAVISGYNAAVIEEALEEAEEAYLKVEVGPRAHGSRLGDLGLEDLGVVVMALGRRGEWVSPVRGETVLLEGDVLLVKYYRGSLERELLRRLESLFTLRRGGPRA